MGVHGLWQLLQPAGKPIALESLEGKILAVDVSIWLNKAAKGMRDKFGNPVYNAHLIVIFQRLCKLLFYKVKPIFVFDGGVPELKKKTIAARRERRLAAEGKVLKARRKILHNYLKGKALETVTGQKGPKFINDAARKDSQDLFELPPLASADQAESSSEDEDNVDIETEWMAGMRSDKVEKMFEELGSVDIDADEFKNLPSEIQHEVLMEMKDSYRRRYNRRKSQEMPEEAHNFSDFQLKNLFRRGKITKKIDEIRKDMKTKSSGHIAEFDEENFLRKKIQSFEANRIASEDKHHYILLKKEDKKGGNILFNSELETNNLEIYEGVRRNENFERLEREPLQFSSSSVDQTNIVSFMSDSTEDSDFDEDFSFNDARKFTIGQGESPKVQNEGPKSQSATVNVPDLLSNQITKPVDSERDKFSKSDEVISSSSEGSSEIEKLSDANDEELVLLNDDVKPTDSSINIPSPRPERDSYHELEHSFSIIQRKVQDVESDASKVAPVSINTVDLTDEGIIAETSQNMNTGDDMSFNEKTSDFVGVSKVASFIKESAVSAKDEEIHIRDKGTNLSDGLSSTETEAGSLSEKKQLHNEEPSSSMKILASNEEDISAVPKPDVRVSEDILHAEAVHEEDNQELRQFKDAVKDCKSAEELSSLRETLASERSELVKERERQSRAAASVGSDEYNDVQELLRLFGIPFIVSPMEAEAQCAVLDLSNQTHGSITDDSDILLFGGRRIYKNIFNQDKYAELYTIENINHSLFLDREKMIALAYLTGSDYTEGIQGVGVITAMEILQEFGGGSMQALVSLKKWYEKAEGKSDLNIFEEETKLKAKLRLLDLPRTFPNHQVWEAYINPSADYSDEPFEWGKPDLDAIREFAHHKLGWRSSRTDEILLPVIKRLNSNQSQTTLNRYFTETLDTTKRKVSSKRLQRTVNLMRSGVTGVANCEPHRMQSNEKKQRINPSHQVAPVDNPGTVSNLPNVTSKNMSYKSRRIPSKRDFQTRVAKSRALSRGRGRRTVRPLRVGTSQEPNKKRIISRKVDLSDSSSDSES